MDENMCCCCIFWGVGVNAVTWDWHGRPQFVSIRWTAFFILFFCHLYFSIGFRPFCFSKCGSDNHFSVFHVQTDECQLSLSPLFFLFAGRETSCPRNPCERQHFLLSVFPFPFSLSGWLDESQTATQLIGCWARPGSQREARWGFHFVCWFFVFKL